MAQTRISDVIVPEVFGPYMLKETMTKADVFNSGLVVPNDELAEKLAGGGTTFQAPVWNDLSDTNGSEIGSDDPSDEIVPDKITAYKMQSRRQFRTKAWSTMDLTSELAGDDPMQRILSRVSEWWARDLNKIAIATLNGVINENVQTNSGDMVYVSGVGTGGSTTPSAAISADVVLDAAQTMGDKSGLLSLLMIHSVVYNKIQKLNLIDFIPDARGEVNIPTYMGKRLLVSDTLPVTSLGGGDYAYTSYLSAPGIIAFGESPPDIPVETERKPAKGMGTGMELLYTRRQFAMHPLGHNWTESSVAGKFPTNTELEAHANWERKFPERKQVPFVAIITKNG